MSKKETPKHNNKNNKKSLKELLGSRFFVNSIYMKTKWRLMETIVDKYQYETLDSIEVCEELVDDVIDILFITGADMYGRYGDGLDITKE